MWKQYLVRIGLKLILEYYKNYLLTLSQEKRSEHAAAMDAMITYLQKKRSRTAQTIVWTLQDWDADIHGDF